MIIAVFSYGASANENAQLALLQNFSETHCELLQKSSLNPSPTLNQRIKELTETPNEFSLRTQYENAPDFGFLLPHYWPVMTWAQRVRFNHAITAFIKRRLEVGVTPLTASHCNAQIRVIEHSDEEMEAIVLMTLAGKNDTIPLTYLYDKGTNGGWELSDIIFHTSSIIERDSAQLETIIRSHGIDELEAHLEQLIN